MASPATKKRKLDYGTSPNGQNNDSASFESFSTSDFEESEREASESLDGQKEHLEAGEAGNHETRDQEDSSDDDESVPAPANEKLDQKARQQPRNRTQQQPNLRLKPIPENGEYTSNTFKSNLFKLQVDDLLGQIRPRHSRLEALAEEALHKLKDTIEKIPAREPMLVEEATRRLVTSDGTVIPFPDPPPPRHAMYKLEFTRPTSINVIGSYALKTASRIKGVVQIDMAMIMPSTIFQDKDYLNHRYFYKRAYFLACIAAELQKTHAHEYRIQFQSLHDNELKPVLVVSPFVENGSNEKNPSPKWEINLIPSAPSEAFSPDKLQPGRCCVRNTTSNSTSETDLAAKQAPTAFYNSSIRSDMLINPYLKLLHTTSKKCPAFQDACLIGNTWLRQRGFASGISSGGFGNFEFCALMALLLENGGVEGRPLLSEAYSSYQLWKATLQFLAVKNLIKEAFSTGPDRTATGPVVLGIPLLWDGSRKHNLAFKMTPLSYKLLRYESETTLNMLADQTFDRFEAAFILRSDLPLYRYDYLLQLPASVGAAAGRTHNNFTFEEYNHLHTVLTRALGDRISLISILPQPSENWPTDFARPQRKTDQHLLIGFVVNPESVHRLVDHGPPADKKNEAAAFQKFWGDKAELRRFKDGSILETVAWSEKNTGPSVFEQIVRHVIKKHVGDDVEQQARLVGDGVRKLLPRPKSSITSQHLTEAFKQLEVDLRGLDDLPLSIRQLTPADAQLRNASSPTALATPADVVIQFEGSSRWPDDLVAIQRTKIAFFLNLSVLLQGSVDNITSRIGLENKDHDIFNQAFLDITYQSGAAFRLRIHHDREQTLLERQLKDKTMEAKSKEVSALGLAKYKRDYIKAPAFTQAIARLSGQYLAMSGTIQLLKKWFACHILANQISDETIEMFAAQTFLQPWPWQAPSSVLVGFFRTLSWISRWDWRNEPLIVDLSGSGEVKQQEVQAIRTRFEAWRKLDPLLNRVVLFCASNIDPDGTAWTDGQPPKVVAARMTALAKAACAEVEEKQLQLEPEALFSSTLTDFDFVIHLHAQFAGTKPRRKQSPSDGVVFKNLELEMNGDHRYDPLRAFLHELEHLFGTAVLFFSGGSERPVIAGLWNPQSATRPWKLNLAYSTTPKHRASTDEVEAELNKEAILGEIARLGGNMIKDIEVHR